MKKINTVFLALLIFVSACSVSKQSTPSSNYVIIAVKGLKETVKILHITDAHISIRSEEEENYHEYASRMDNAFKSVRHSNTLKTLYLLNHS